MLLVGDGQESLSPARVCQHRRVRRTDLRTVAAGFELFYEDLIDSTPSHASRRFLALKVPEIGFEPENVEWHFRRSTGRVVPTTKKAKSRQPAKTAKPRKRATADVKAKREQAKRDEAERLKIERRKMIAEQFRQWEERRQLRAK